MKKNIIFWIVKVLAKILTVGEVIGYEQIPQSGAYVLTTNHTSMMDTPFLMLSTPRTDVTGLVARKYKDRPFFGWFLNSIGVIWVTQDATDFVAFRQAVNYLKKGWGVGIAPEGTRSHNHTLLKGKPGAVLLAERAKVPIVPVAVVGAGNFKDDLLHLRRNRFTVHFGKVYTLPPMDPSDHKKWLRECTDEVMCQIAALLPEENRGEYADHPRVKELLGE